MTELIERTRLAAKILRDIGGQSAMAATVDEAAAALEAAREDATPPVTSPATSPVRILIDAIESEIRQLEGKSNWMSQAARIASLRAAIDQARGKGVQGA